MNKRHVIMSLCLIGVLSTLLGCVTMPQNIALQNDLSSVKEIVAQGNPPPDVMKISGGAAVFGAMGMAAAGNIMMKTYSLPDFGQLVLYKLLSHIRTEYPKWPAVSVLKSNNNNDNDNASMVLHPGQYILDVSPSTLHVRYLGVKGIHVMTTAQLKTSSGNVVWRQSFLYKSQDYGRDAQIDKFEDDNGKLLKEEWDFAAEETANNFITSLRK